jgi:hypothetical protein
MTPEELLLECETLTYHDRMHRMVELGQQAASDSSISETLAALAQGDVYQRILATQSCYGSRDTAQIVQSLSDPSRSVNELALDLAALVCSDAELQEVFTKIQLNLQLVLVRKLCRRHREAQVDLYLETLIWRNDATLRELLPYGSQSLVARYIEQASEQFDLVSLGRLARKHPELVIKQLRTLASARTTFDPQFVSRVNTVLPILSEYVPDLALDLVKTLLPIVSLVHLNLRTLVYKRPNEVVDLVLESNEQSTLRFDAVAHRLNTERLLALFTHYPGTLNINCFGKLRPQQRLVLYTACERGWRNDKGVLAYQIVASLPTEQRVREGRRHLELPALATRPLVQLPYAAFLPWEEMRALLDTPLHSPNAALRGVALKTLISAMRYQRSHLTDVLQIVRNRRNERDPVRREMLTALAALPHSIWLNEHLDDLAQIISDAFNATDLSHSTAQAIEWLVVHTFPFHPEWSANQLAIIYRARGRVNIYRLDRYLTDKHVRSIAPVLTPILQSWQNRENVGLLLTLAIALDKRLNAIDELVDLLEITLDQTLVSHIANSILHLFLQHCRSRAHLLIPRILTEDKSAITLPSVYTYLHRQRQDLLTPFLGQYPYKGRFSTGHTRFVLPLNEGFYRWTSTQQEIFAGTLLEVIRAKDQNRAIYEWLVTIKRLAAMPAIDFTPLIQLASDEQPAVRDAALRSLGKLDAGQGIPTLIEALNDERARIAIYGLRSALLSMPQTEALSLLHNAPLTQVTVAKEVVRLIGELSSEEAYRELLSWETRELHRDVRVALLRALWDYLEEPETWEIFTRAAQSPDPALARGVVHIPADSMSPLTQQRLTTLTATLLTHPTTEVRMATLEWRSQHPITDHEHALFSSLLALLNSPLPDECTLAAKAVFSIYTGNDATLVGNAISGLLSNQHALRRICETSSSALVNNRRHLQNTAQAILTALSKDKLTISLRVKIIIAGLPWNEVEPELVKLTNELHAIAISNAWRGIRQATTRPDAGLHDLEINLAANSDERLRLLALAALIAQSTQASGWSDEAIERLEIYRNDPSPMVAEIAQFTFVS